MRIGECKHWDWSKPRPSTYTSSYILIGIISFSDGCIFGSPSHLNINNAAKETCLFRWMCRWRAHDCWSKKMRNGGGVSERRRRAAVMKPTWWIPSIANWVEEGCWRSFIFVHPARILLSIVNRVMLARAFLDYLFSTYHLLHFIQTVSTACPSFFFSLYTPPPSSLAY